jgi:hypothetical protein
MIFLVLIAGVGDLLIYFSIGGLCIDSFAVVSPAAQWPTWAVTVPLVLWIAFISEEKETLSRYENIVLVLQLFCFIVGYLKNLNPPLWLILMIVYCFMANLSIIVYCFYYARKSNLQLTNRCALQVVDQKSNPNDLQTMRSILKGNLLFLLSITLPLFGLIYILSATKAIDSSMTVALFTSCGFIAKFLFLIVIRRENLAILIQENCNAVILAAKLELIEVENQTSVQNSLVAAAYEAQVAQNITDSKVLAAQLENKRVILLNKLEAMEIENKLKVCHMFISSKCLQCLSLLIFLKCKIL